MNKRKLLTCCSFVIASLAVIAAFMTATTYIQLAVAILLYPVLAFFAYKVFLHNWSHTKPPLQELSPLPAKPTEIVEAAERGNVGIADIDKRVFLKLIGGAGLSFFLFSIFNKRAEGLFPGPAGNKIDPVQKKPLDGYSISDIEYGTINYYGFVSEDSSWYIMRLDTSTSAFRYTKDKSNFRANWINRGNLKYDFFDSIFKP